MDEIGNHIGIQIRNLRAAFNNGQGLPQARLAELLGTATNTITRWERGVYIPSIPDLYRLSQVFGVKIASLLPDSPAPVPFDTGRFHKLFLAVQTLSDQDLEEVRLYAEFRRSLARDRSGRDEHDESVDNT